MGDVRTKIEALKDLGDKVTGKTINVEENDTIVGMIDKIAKNYKAPSSGTKVEANPALSGTESNLVGLKVGDTKYKVPQGPFGFYELLDDAYMQEMADGLYEVCGGAKLYYNNENYIEVDYSGNEYGGLLQIFGGGSTYIFFEGTTGGEDTEARIHYGLTGENGTHHIFTIPED